MKGEYKIYSRDRKSTICERTLDGSATFEDVPSWAVSPVSEGGVLYTSVWNMTGMGTTPFVIDW